MKGQISAADDLKAFAQNQEYTDKAVMDMLLSSGHWKKPITTWTEETVITVRADLETALWRIPFSHRFDVLTLINKFFQRYIPETGFVPFAWEKMHDKSELQIEILKLTQGGTNPTPNKRNKTELGKALHISRTALRPYLDELQAGTNVLGSEAQISLSNKTNVYDSTIHPVFMALNLSEVNFLVNQLRLHFRGTDYERMATEISADIYRQLSEYAQQRMSAVARNNGRDLEMDYYWQRPQGGYRKELNQQEIPYLTKCRCCSISKKESPSDKKYGHVVYEKGKYIFVGKDSLKIVLDEHVLGEYDIRQCDGELAT